MSDSAFRRLLLDTVSAVITTRPPSTSSLVELLRIATPDLVLSSSPNSISEETSSQQATAESIVRRDAVKREKMYRALQLKIHPDKHPGDERATQLFQDVTTYYERCVLAMESEREITRSNCEVHPATSSNIDGATELGTKYRQDAVNLKRGGADYRGDQSLPQWIPPFLSAWWPSPVTTSAHSDYVNSDDHERYRRTLTPSQRRHHDRLFPQRRENGCGGIAKLACLCIMCLCIVWYFWLGDGDYDWDWDRIKHENNWFSDGP